MIFNALIPELSVTDIDRTRQFYTDILGFHVEYERQEDKFLFLSFGKAQLMLPLYRDLSVAEYKANEARLVIKEILLQDPDGYLLRFSETVAVK